MFPDMEDKYAAQVEAYKAMPDEDLFDVMEVELEVRDEDMPGRPMRRVRCDRCGEYVQDMREVVRDGTVLCRACEGESYYKMKKGFFVG
jgi:formylmethanofuran dehydrogenase subunit E